MNCFKRKALAIAGILFAMLAIAGCATTNETRKAEADAQVALGNARVAEAQAAIAQAQADKVLFDKLDTTGAGNTALLRQLKGLGIGAAQPVQIASSQPQSVWGVAWQAALGVADVALRAYGIKATRDVGITSSNNQRDIAVSTNAAFLGMGNSIMQAGTAGYQYVQAPGAITTTTTTNTLSGTGVLGSGTYTAPITTTNRNCNGGQGAAGGAGDPGGAGGSGAGGNC